MKNREIFEFEKEIDTGSIIYHEIGRFKLVSGNAARIMFTPDGVKLSIMKESLENGDIFVHERWCIGEKPIRR